MYLDVIYNHKDEIIFNSTPAETVEFLLEVEDPHKDAYWIIRGENLQGFSYKDYLLWMRAV